MSLRTRFIALLFVGCMACAGLAEEGERLSIEGVADAGQFEVPPGEAAPVSPTERVQRQACTDAIYHAAAFTQGLAFDLDVTSAEEPFKLSDTTFASLGTALPKSKEFRVLQSQLVLARLVYDVSDIKKLLPEDLLELPVHRSPGSFHNPQVPFPLTTLHWKAARDCCRSAVMLHVAKTYGNREIARAKGRVYAVRFIEATLAPAPEPPSPSPAGAAPGSGPAAQPAEGTAPESEEQELKFDSRKYIYQLQMDVRVRLDDIVFADETPPSPDAGQTAPGASAPTAPEAPVPGSVAPPAPAAPPAVPEPGSPPPQVPEE